MTTTIAFSYLDPTSHYSLHISIPHANMLTNNALPCPRTPPCESHSVVLLSQATPCYLVIWLSGNTILFSPLPRPAGGAGDESPVQAAFHPLQERERFIWFICYLGTQYHSLSPLPPVARGAGHKPPVGRRWSRRRNARSPHGRPVRPLPSAIPQSVITSPKSRILNRKRHGGEGGIRARSFSQLLVSAHLMR